MKTRGRDGELAVANLENVDTTVVKAAKVRKGIEKFLLFGCVVSVQCR